MYDLGRKKLLRKCENKQMPSMVVSLAVTGDRVFAGDQMESCHCFKYRRAENQLVEFADDQVRYFSLSLAVHLQICQCQQRKATRVQHNCRPCSGGRVNCFALLLLQRTVTVLLSSQR